MNYIVHLFFNHLPHVEQETRFVDGEEQECLIIPTKINQLKKGRQGNWLMTLRLDEEPPNAKLITHTVQLGYLNWDEYDKAKAMGYYYRTQHMGRVRVHDRTPSKKVNRSNKGTDLRCDGIIVLSDIPKRLIFRNAENDKRYVSDLMFRPCGDDSILYTGSICIDDIPHGHILTDPGTGKKYINARFLRMEALDTYMNTHHLVIVDDGGSEIEIGRFKEWRKEVPTEAAPEQGKAESHDTTITPRPLPPSIDGVRF